MGSQAATVQRRTVAASHSEAKQLEVKQLTLTDYLVALASAELDARRHELDAVQHGTLTLTVEIKDGILNFMEVVVVEKKTKHALAEIFAALAAPPAGTAAY